MDSTSSSELVHPSPLERLALLCWPGGVQGLLSQVLQHWLRQPSEAGPTGKGMNKPALKSRSVGELTLPLVCRQAIRAWR